MKPTRKVLAASALVIAGGLLVFNLLTVAGVSPFPDLTLLFPQIERWWEGQGELYPPTEAVHLLEPGAAIVRYPPLWVASMLPFATGGLGHRAAAEIVAGVLVAAMLLGMVLAMRHAAVPWQSPGFGLVFVVLAAFAPLYETFYGPAFELAIVGLMLTVFVLSERRRPWLAGLFFALAILLKVYPVLFGFYFLLRRDFRVLYATAGWGLLLSVIAVPVVGLNETLIYHFDMLPGLGGDAPDIQNAGINFALMLWSRMMWFRHGIELPSAWPEPQVHFYEYYNHALALLAKLAVVTLFSAVAVLLERKGGLGTPLHRLLLFGVWWAAILLLIPVPWVNYQLILIVPIGAVILWLAAGRLTWSRGGVLVLLALLVVTLSTPFNARIVSRYIDPAMPRGERLATFGGGVLEDEMELRVVHRSSQLDALDLDPSLGERPRRLIRAALSAHGVDDLSNAGPGHVRALAQRDSLRRQYDRGPTEQLEIALARADARVRSTGLSTFRLFGFLWLRGFDGVLAFVTALLATVVLLRESSRPSPPSSGGEPAAGTKSQAPGAAPGASSAGPT